MAPGWTVTWWALRRLGEIRQRNLKHDNRLIYAGRVPEDGASHAAVVIELCKRGY